LQCPVCTEVATK